MESIFGDTAEGLGKLVALGRGDVVRKHALNLRPNSGREEGQGIIGHSFGPAGEPRKPGTAAFNSKMADRLSSV